MRTKIRIFFETTNHFGTYLHIGRLIIIEASYFFGIIFVTSFCLYHRVILSKAKDLGGMHEGRRLCDTKTSSLCPK